MKEYNLLFIVIVGLVLLAVCGCTNIQSSSMEEAIFVVQQDKNCKEILQYCSVSSGNSWFPDDPFVYESLPEFDFDNNKKTAIHYVIFSGRDDGIYLWILNDQRPPEPIIKKKLK